MMRPATEGPWESVADLIRQVLPRHPHLKGRAVPKLGASADAVWLEVDGVAVARIGGGRWWGSATTIFARMLADELVREMRDSARSRKGS